MRRKGLTLVELLIVIVVGLFLLLLSVLSLNGIQSKGRDAKRINDINNLRQVMSMIKEETGTYMKACSGYVGAVSGCQGQGDSYMLLDSIDALNTMNDPTGKNVLCNATCSTMPCNYNILSVTPDTYEVRFFLERSTTDYKRGCHKLTERGIE